jgi:Family of unknown function (DUF5825)
VTGTDPGTPAVDAGTMGADAGVLAGAAPIPPSALASAVNLARRVAVLDEPLHFGRSLSEDLRLLRLLREATSHAVRLRWQLAGRPCIPLRSHVHLLPPAGGVDPPAQAYARTWAARYRYGSFYYRLGPDFITVKDTRPDGESSRMVITDGATEFREMVDAATVDDLTPSSRRMLPEAVDAGLALVTGATLVILPYRLRHWPVPLIAV